jgi:hypothetical protein
MIIGRRNERLKERVRRQRPRFKFWMKLTADKPGMILELHNLHQAMLGIFSGDDQAGRLQTVLIFGIEFIAVAVAFADQLLPVNGIGQCSLLS